MISSLNHNLNGNIMVYEPEIKSTLLYRVPLNSINKFRGGGDSRHQEDVKLENGTISQLYVFCLTLTTILLNLSVEFDNTLYIRVEIYEHALW